MAKVQLDTTDFNDKEFQKFLKKRKIKAKFLKDDPANKFADQYEYTGNSLFLQDMIDDFWDDKKLYSKIEESDANEGRAFVAAAKKAKEEGKKEFEFNGKTYPVTIKDVSEEVIVPSYNEFVNEMKKWDKDVFITITKAFRIFDTSFQPGRYKAERGRGGWTVYRADLQAWTGSGIEDKKFDKFVADGTIEID